MALTGVFLADFSDFYDACQKAEVSVKSIGDGANKVGPQLNRMVEQFSGKKLVQEATVMARAIEEIGGVSKLTEAEMKRVGVTMNAAMEKMRASGEKIPANMQQIADATKGANKASTDWLGTLTKMAGVIGIAFSAQAVIGFVSSIFTAATAIKDLSEEWGVSAEAAQRFTFAAKQSGAGAEAVGASIKFMTRELGEGSKGYQAIVNALGLSFDRLSALSPEAAFREMVTAIAGIEDPMLQADYAVKLFGRTAQELLPAIRADFLAVADSTTVMSDETVTRLEAAGQAWENLKNQVTIFTGELINETMKVSKVAFASWGNFFENIKIRLTQGVDAQEKWVDSQLAAMDTAQKATAQTQAATPVARTHADAIRSTAAVLEQQRRAEDSAKAAQASRRAELDRITKAQNDYNATLRKLADDFSGGALIDKAHLWLQALEDTVPIAQMSEAAQADIHKTMRDGIEAYERLGTVAPAAMRDVYNATIKQIPVTQDLNALYRSLTTVPLELWANQTTDAMGRLFTTVGEVSTKAPSMFKGLSGALGSAIGDSIRAAIQGGGNIIQAAGSTIGQFLLDPEKGGIGKGLVAAASKLPGALGGILSTAIPVVGSLVGPAIDLAVKGFKKLFGIGESEKEKIAKLRTTFIDTAGGIDSLRQRAEEAGVSINNLLNAKKVETYNAALKELDEAFKFQADSIALAMETAQRYGFTLEELGPALQRQELDKQAQQLFKDWEVLNAAGLETIAITARMGEEVSAYVNQAVKMGTDVPDAMRPMLEQMVKMGTLTDASGNKVESLEAAGISFALTMSEGFKALIDSVGKLTTAISRGLGLAIEDTSEKIKKVPRTIDVQTRYSEVGRPAGSPRGLESYQDGTDGFRNFGAGTPVMLHGMEAVIPASAPSVPFFGGGGAAVAPITVVINAQGALFDTPGDLQRLADRVESALSAKHGLTHKRRAA